MNILINVATLKKGGGQNVALNFVSTLHEVDTDNINFYFAVVKNTDIYFYLKKINATIILVPESPLKRIFFELIKGSSIINKHDIDIIYTIFGIGLYPKKTPQISGSADSNLFFPEIDFWSEYNGFSKLVKKGIDFYRIKGLKRATAVIFENEELQERSKILYSLKETKLILPSINKDFKYKDFKLPKKLINKPKGLFLCGWQLNKNYMKIPEIAFQLKQKKRDFHFLITSEKDNSSQHKLFMSLLKKYEVEDMVEIIGSVKKDELKSLYKQIDIVFLLSKLESFSNNIIEAWTFERPLMITNASWSRSICKNAAVYVDRDSPSTIANAIIELIENTDYRKLIVKEGVSQLKSYPIIKQRTISELNYIKEIYEKYY